MLCHPESVHEGSKKAILAAFLANLGIAVAKFVGFVITGSAGLLAEAGHSLADTGNQALLLLGSRRAQRQRDAKHPFGYGSERYFWAFVVALVMFSMGGLFALYEGIDKLRHPHRADQLGVAIAILGLSIILEALSLRTAVREVGEEKPAGMSWMAFIRRTKSPELPTVLLEDTAALIGLVLALAGVILAQVTGNPRWDAVGSVAIGVLLIVVAFVLAREMKGLLVGEAADPEVERAIIDAVNAAPRVRRVIHLRTMHVGPDEALVALKVEFDHSLGIHELADAIDETERHLRDAVPLAKTVYIEPDIYRAERAGADPSSAGRSDRGEPARPPVE